MARLVARKAVAVAVAGAMRESVEPWLSLDKKEAHGNPARSAELASMARAARVAANVSCASGPSVVVGQEVERALRGSSPDRFNGSDSGPSDSSGGGGFDF